MANNSLPIARFETEILKAVADHGVVIVTAETGAGKSTQVPQYLLRAGYDIVVTQPRILAARSVAERVAYEVGCEFGELVGYRTANERCDSDETRCLFVTDGLALVRELMGSRPAGDRPRVLVIDEVHEWNLNIEVLIAWAKRQIAQGQDFKVVIMSATLESDRLSAYFNDAPVVNVPGRLFPVTEQVAGESVEADTLALLQAGHNVLVFQPGKAEIEATVAWLKEQEGLNAEILPLHGQLTAQEQKKCFRIDYGRPKCVVATNVAQTSVTIPDIDAVVDSGMERRIEVVDGVEGLYLRPISLADARQRRGRAGRVKAGVYIDHCPAERQDRPAFPVAEILRSRLDQDVLRLAIAGFDMEELEFFHQPEIAEIREAKRALKALGCMDENGRVTRIGRAVNKLPVSVQYARMVVEADRLGVVDDVVTIAAILEQGGITARFVKDEYGDRVSAKRLWQRLTGGETQSDAIAQLRVFKAARNMSKSEMYENGILIKAFYQAKERRRHLARALRGSVSRFESNGSREAILHAICAGMADHFYVLSYGEYTNEEGQMRKLAQESVVYEGDYVLGLPFDLQFKLRKGGFGVHHLLTMVTRVDPDKMCEIAPQLVKIEEGLSPYYDAEIECVVSTTRTYFDGIMVKEEEVQDPNASKIMCWGKGVIAKLFDK